MRIKLIVAVLLIGFTFWTSCHKEDKDVYVPPDSSFGLMYQKIFIPSCALSGCHDDVNHGNEGHEHGVTLEGAETYAGLINVSPKNGQAQLAGLKQIVPGDISKSWLFQKITYDNSPHKYGAPMPGGGLTLTANQIEFVKQWIEAGAPLDGQVADAQLLK
jgi:hypothetical protein